MRLLNQIRFLPYRIVRRIGTADISRVFGIETSEIPTQPLGKEFSFAEISSAEIGGLIAGCPQCFSKSQATELALDNIYCFVIFQADAMAAFAWLAIGNVAPEFNHNGDLQAGLPVLLPPDTGFVYNVYVLPRYRGRRLYGSIMRELAQVMRTRGVTRLILTTDATNTSSLRALQRMGFQDLGKAWLLRVGPFSMARYPSSPVFGTVRFGRYLADTRSSRV